MNVLNVAEKPSAAKEISKLLSRGSRMTTRDGFSPYNKVFEFDALLEGQPAHFFFTSVSGHLKERDFSQHLRRWEACSPVQITVADNMKPIQRTLEREARNCSILILWLDCDSEGENIAYEVKDVCCSANRRVTVRRARFSAITFDDVQNALRSLGDLDPLLNDMVEARQELDLRAGVAFTRFLTKRIRDQLLAQTSQVTSYGPCQFPTLALVVDRFMTIQTFVSQDFYVIDLSLRFTLKSLSTVVKFNWNRVRLFDRYIASAIFELCHEAARDEQNEHAIVTEVKKTRRTRWRPLPLATVEMQKQVSRKLGLTSDATMEAAEKLYTSGYISYPRTETDAFNRTINLRELVARQQSDRRWGDFATRLLQPEAENDPVRFTWPRDGKHDDHAHPPIHPTKPMPSEGFASREMEKVYEYVSRRFLACCSIDAVGSETVISARVGCEGFHAKGLIVEQQGFYEVFIYDKWTDKNLPPVQQGDRVRIESMDLRDGKTEPPPLLSESDLISLMDRHGIGTDATISKHISKIQEREYVSKTISGRFQPEPLGLALVESFERCHVYLARPHVRAEQEVGLKNIAAGQTVKEEMLSGSLSEFDRMYAQLQTNVGRLDEAFRLRFPAASTSMNWRLISGEFAACGHCTTKLHYKEADTPATSGASTHRGASINADSVAHRILFCSTLNRSLKLPVRGTISGTGQLCPICNYEVIRFQTTSSYTLCPWCFNYPPQGESNPQNRVSGSFRCFNCSQGGCSLATGVTGEAMNVCVCPSCGSECNLRRASVFRISCSCSVGHCNFVYFFPRAVEEVMVTPSPCPQCQSKTMTLSFKRDSIPLGSTRQLNSVCLWCSPQLHAFFESIGEPRPVRQATAGRGVGRGPRSRGSAHRSASSRSRGSSSGSTRGRGGRGSRGASKPARRVRRG